MMVELESTNIKINLVSPGFTKTNLNGFEGMESLKDGSREVVRIALPGADGPSGTFTMWENKIIPWSCTVRKGCATFRSDNSSCG